MYKFIGKIKQGAFIPRDQEKYHLWLSSLEDKDVELTLNKLTRERTNQQNRLMWFYIRLISAETGYTEDEVYALLKSIFLKEYKDIKNKRYTVIRSTADLTTVEFAKFIEQTKEWSAKEIGLFLPEPENINLN